MFAQFFGNYLLNKQLVTPEQLITGIQAKNETRLKLGVLAISAGYMSAAQVEEVHERQMLEDKRIGDIAVELGYLTKEQLEELLDTQKVGYLLLGQALVDKGYLTNGQFETAISDYKHQYQIDESESDSFDDEKAEELIRSMCDFSSEDAMMYTKYLVLVMKNLIRFIGDDFTPLKPTRMYPLEIYKDVYQKINGSFTTDTNIVFESADSMLAFANRFSGEGLGATDGEYIDAAVCDFLNINNGLYTVNVSNELNMELRITPPEVFDDMHDTKGSVMTFPVAYTFGTIYITLSE